MTPYEAEQYLGSTARPDSLRDACAVFHAGRPCARPHYEAPEPVRVGWWEVAEIVGGVLIFGSLLLGLPLLLWLMAGGAY